jgi:hypothetical protein
MATSADFVVQRSGDGCADRQAPGSDRRSIGRSEEVVSEVLADPGQFRLVFDAMLMPDPVVRMRAADAVEKLTRRRPDLLRGLEGHLLTEVAAIDQKEVRWHVAQLLPDLP